MAPVSNKTTSEILRRARETLAITQRSLRDAITDPARRDVAIRNVAVFGRAVTNVLQNLRSTESAFDDWYVGVKKDMESDELMRFFYALRSRILKQGDARTGSYAHIASLSWPQDERKFGPPPKNAKSFFMGDALGGSGWEVEVSPGVIEKFYVNVPPEIGDVGMFFGDISETDPRAADATTLCRDYVERLEQIVSAAEARFGAPA
jgi:hypothetical protein